MDGRLAVQYHLGEAGPKANDWQGVQTILQHAQVKTVPKAATAVFVGQKFDPFTGRGGKNGEPLRRTPWGEIAWQLGGASPWRLLPDTTRRESPRAVTRSGRSYPMARH